MQGCEQKGFEVYRSSLDMENVTKSLTKLVYESEMNEEQQSVV